MKAIPILTILPAKTKVQVASGTLLASALQDAGMHLLMPCSGRGTCGKCTVYAKGDLAPITSAEKRLLSMTHTEARNDYTLRLSCMVRVLGDASCYPLQEGQASVLTSQAHALPPYDGDDENALGIAIDIGTTTIALTLHSLAKGQSLANAGALNRQGAFGADVLSRIAFANENGLARPVQTIREQLTEMMQSVLREASVPAAQLRRIVITGNTTMLHFVRGMDPKGIGAFPFTPESYMGDSVPAETLFPSLQSSATVYMPHCISAYVGADITSGIWASGMAKRSATTLLIDVGTNGEMALSKGDRLFCCSTAAGPAFEGAQISMGMPAKDGAITKVHVADMQITFDTIGNLPAKGLCGTGLISAIVAMRKLGALSESGGFEDDAYPFFKEENVLLFMLGDSNVSINRADIRQVQLAKAAIRAGIEALLAEANIPYQAVDEVLLAGGFGNFIDPCEAANIGLIPRELARITKPAGNLALVGATRMLYDQTERQSAQKIALTAKEISLATNPVFMDQYIEHMLFPEELLS